MLAAKKQAAQLLPEVEQQPGLVVVKKPHKKLKRANRRKIVAGITALALGLCFSLVFLEAQLGELGYQINQVDSQIADKQVKCEQLELEVAQLRSLDRVEDYAINKLGMVYLNSANILYMNYDKGTENSSTATTASTNKQSVATAQQQAGEQTAASTGTANADSGSTTKNQSLLGKLGEVLRNIFAQPANAANTANV